jgi:hypothetical protein
MVLFQVVSPPGRIATRECSRVHSRGNDPDITHARRAVHARPCAKRELDFALRAHSKVWRLGERIVRPPHVRRALELCGCARSSLRMHFGRLVKMFSEGEESEDDDDDDMPLVVRARKAIVSDEDEDEDVNTSVGEREQQQQQQQAGPSKDVQATEPAWQRWSSSHRAIYSPFVHAPDLIAPAHLFGVYAPGTTVRPSYHSSLESRDVSRLR